MCWIVVLSILGILLLITIILGAPRKQCERVPSFEGIDDAAVAKAFERVTNFPPFKLLRKMVVRQLKLMKPAGTLVDVGCGTGKLLIDIAHELPYLSLIGVDIAEEMVNQAGQNASARGQGKKIEFKLGTAERLPFEDNAVDFVVSTLSLHHWAHPEANIQELFRVLKPGGIFLIFDFRRDARKAFYGLFNFATNVVVPKALKKVREPLGSILASYTPEEMNDIFTKIKIPIEIQPRLVWMFLSGKKDTI